MWNIIFIVLAIFIWGKFFGEESGCEKYASKYSCSFVEEKATYDVYYWARVNEDNEKDNKLIGTITGLRNCRDAALRYSISINDKWTERSYICVLVKDGKSMEKHRL